MKADDDRALSNKKEKAALTLHTDNDDKVPSSSLAAQERVMSSSSSLPSSSKSWLDTWTAILTSPRHVTALKTGQYVSCVQLALALFAQEFFESNNNNNNKNNNNVMTYRAEQVLFGVAVALPVVLWHLPVAIGLFSALPTSTVRRAAWAAFGRQVVAEGALLAGSLALIILAVVLSIQNHNDDDDDDDDDNYYYDDDYVFHWAVSVPGAMLAVNYYFFSGSVWGSYKTVLVQLRPPDDNASAWAAACAQHAAVVAAAPRGAVAVWFRLMRRFPVSSAVAWISLICYTSCLPLQGLTVGYITQTIAEATPESSFVELFTPGKKSCLSCPTL